MRFSPELILWLRDGTRPANVIVKRTYTDAKRGGKPYGVISGGDGVIHVHPFGGRITPTKSTTALVGHPMISLARSIPHG